MGGKRVNRGVREMRGLGIAPVCPAPVNRDKECDGNADEKYDEDFPSARVGATPGVHSSMIEVACRAQNGKEN